MDRFLLPKIGGGLHAIGGEEDLTLDALALPELGRPGPEVEAVDCNGHLAHEETPSHEVDAVAVHVLQDHILTGALVDLEAHVFSADLLHAELRHLTEYEEVLH